MRKRDIKHNYLVGSISIGLLSLVAIALLCPSVDRTSYATDCAPGEEPCTTTQAEAGIDLTVASTVSVALQNLINLEVTPKTSGAFTESTAKLTVATNNPSGYAVYMQAGSTTNGKASLVSSDLSNTAMINPVSGTVESNSFAANTWGYSLDGTHYQAVPTTTGIIKETSSTTFSDTYDLSFGVNVDTNLPAGQYTNSVIVSAVANPIIVTSLSQLNYMQDMTTDICTNTAEHVTKQLIDTRDGKSYWVAKLKDGNCWMTQNLDLDISVANGNAAAMSESGQIVALTNENTDISTSYWNASTGWAPVKTAATVPDASVKVYDGTYSWDAGKIILSNPTATENCGVNIESGAKLSSLSTTCPRFFKAIATGMLDTYTATVTSSFDETTNTYDAHYLVGNYYSWGAATAGTGKQATNDEDDASGSICAKGWKMPTGSEQASLIYDAYKLRDGAENIKMSRIKPLYFVRGGEVAPHLSSPLFLTTGVGRYWSSTHSDSSDASAYVLSFDADYFNTIRDSEIFSFYEGFSVRCLAR